jgi:hypothetical protein
VSTSTEADVEAAATPDRAIEVVAADVAQAREYLRKLEQAAAGAFDPMREMRISRAREQLTALEQELDELRRRDDEHAASEAEQLAVVKAAERVELENRWPTLEQQAHATRWAVEQAIDNLVDAIEAAVTAGAELERVDQELERPRHALHRARPAIENRLARRLACIGIRDLGVPLGNGGREPLAKKPQKARR